MPRKRILVRRPKSRSDEVARMKWLRHWGSAALCLPRVSLFFLPLLVSFVSRLGLVRLGSAVLGPRTAFSFLLTPRASHFSFAGPLFPSLAPLAGPHGYQPLVFTSDQVGGDLDKTTNKLKVCPLPVPPRAQRADTSVR